MANNTDSNYMAKIAKGFLKEAECERVLSKSVDVQLLDGKFNDESGSETFFKRPHDFNTIETSDGDISSSTKSDIISGKAKGTVQDYITVATEWTNVVEALELNNLEGILKPVAKRMMTKLELNLGQFMNNNAGLVYGTPGTAVDAWSDVSGASALMSSVGVPQDSDWMYVMNPYTQTALADAQNGLASGSNSLVDTAWERAQISNRFGGMLAMQSSALKTRTSSDASDRAGTLSATPTATYLSVKDSMQQTLAVTGFSANAVVKAGDIVQVATRGRTSLATRELILNASGGLVAWTGVVTADVTLNGSGAGNLVVSGPAIFEANGQYNTVNAALTSGDVITILGAANGVYQPNLFYHKQAFGIGSVKIPKLFSTDTTAITKDGLAIRCSKYSDGDANKQMIRFDLLPAFACFNPYFAGQGFGV